MKPLLIVILVFISTIAFAQNESYTESVKNIDTIRTYKTFWNTTYFVGQWRPLSLKRLQSIVTWNEQASAYIRAARTDKIFADIFGFCGGFTLGYGTVELMYHNEAPARLFVISGLLLANSIMLDIASQKKVRKAIRVYNDDILNRNSSATTTLHLGFAGNTVGLVMNF